jgi:hypothetical protein
MSEFVRQHASSLRELILDGSVLLEGYGPYTWRGLLTEIELLTRGCLEYISVKSPQIVRKGENMGLDIRDYAPVFDCVVDFERYSDYEDSGDEDRASEEDNMNDGVWRGRE